jgi:hypothetical protein
MKKRLLRKLAYHEAGRAVAAIVMGRKVDRIVVDCWTDRSDTSLVPDVGVSLFDQVTILMAGLQAERQRYRADNKRPRTLWSMHRASSWPDYEEARALGADAKLIECCEAAAQQIVKSYWGDVDALGEAIVQASFQKRMLTGAEIESIIAWRSPLRVVGGRA